MLYFSKLLMVMGDVKVKQDKVLKVLRRYRTTLLSYRENPAEGGGRRIYPLPQRGAG